MILEGEKAGQLTPGKIILDATSGNTGIAYAMIGAARGYKVRLCLPKNVTPERKKILSAYGAEIVYTPPAEQSDGAIRRSNRCTPKTPTSTFIPTNTATTPTGRRISRRPARKSGQQTEGRITHFVAGLGTTGTMMGTGRFLHSVNPEIKLISMQPDSPFNGLEGLKHLETAIVPPIYDPTVADENIECRTEDAYVMVKRLAREEGLLGRHLRRRQCPQCACRSPKPPRKAASS